MSTGVPRSGAGASGNPNEKRQLEGMGDELDAFWEEELQRRPEVRIINKYAVVMAYIRIGLKGIGALALLWATVVLLGGFVSDLRKIDFWYLTVIAFVQAAGLYDAMGDVRLVFLQDWILSLLESKRSISPGRSISLGERLKRGIYTLPLDIIDSTLILIFGPVVYFALSGPILCVTLSALRVVKQDYGIADGDASKANLKPALTLFYCVSLAHGAICFLCTIIQTNVEILWMDIFIRQHGLSREVFEGYLHETKQMCVNNPASAESWSLITYGAGLLDSQLPEDYASGGRVLTMLIDQGIPVSITRLLIRSPRQRIQKLIGTLAWRSPAEREMRWLAARIVEHLAGHLNLAQFPGALECISSLLDTSCHNNGDQEALHLPFVIGRSKPRKRRSFLDNSVSSSAGVYLESISRKYLAPTNRGTLEQDIKQRENGEGIDEDLVLPGLRILENLAHNSHNCALIYNTEDLLSKIVAPVSSNKLIEDIKSSAAWTKVVDGSLKVVSRLMGSSGSTGIEMRRIIANNSNAVKNLEAVLGMDTGGNSSVIVLQMRVIQVLTQLALHHPASTSTEKLIERALHIFLTADWMRDYLEDEKRKIDQSTTIQQNTLSRPSMRTRLNNLVNKLVNEARAFIDLEKLDQLAAEARAEKKMKEAQETASRLKEKVGEALAMLPSDSEAIKSFTVCDDDVHRLTELLDTKIKTIECEISATDTVKIEINIGCRISAAVILKHLSNYVQEPTLRKVLAQLLPIQAEASSTSTPNSCSRITSIRNDIEQCASTVCITATINNTENPSDGGQDEPSPSHQSSSIQQCGERRLQAELISLVAATLANRNFDFAAILTSPPLPVARLEDFVVRLKKMVEDNMYATPACLVIQKLSCQMVTGFLQHDQNVELVNKHNIVATLLEASKAMAGLESSMLFAGVDRDCHGVPLRPLSSVLAKNAEHLLTHRKQALGINNAPARAPVP